MERISQKAIKALVKSGVATDITNVNVRVTHHYDKVFYSRGTCGINALVIRDITGQLYAITCETSSLSLY